MEIRLLRTFDAIVQHGSFTAAAGALGYTQSAVSQHVAALEASLGVTLFERRPFGLTPAARRLAEHAGNILLRLDVATSEMTTIDRRTPIALVATPFACGTDEVARLLARDSSQPGASSATLSTASIDEVVASVARGQCSAGVVDGVVGRSDPLATADPGLLTSLLLRVAPLSVVMPDDHPFASARQIAWTSVADARWVDAPNLVPHMGPGALQLLDLRWGRTRYTGTDPSVLGALVGRGHGLALVPSWWDPGAASVCLVPLTSPALVHRIEVLVLRQHAEEWNHLVTAVRAG